MQLFWRGNAKASCQKKAEIPKLVKRVNMENILFESSDSSSTDDEISASFRRKGSSSRNRNPAMESLEQHGGKFPVETKTKRSSEPTLSTSSTIYHCASSNKQEEREQLDMVLHHSMLEQQHPSARIQQHKGVYLYNIFQHQFITHRLSLFTLRPKP